MPPLRSVPGSESGSSRDENVQLARRVSASVTIVTSPAVP
jgi:hypothetical protein